MFRFDADCATAAAVMVFTVRVRYSRRTVLAAAATAVAAGLAGCDALHHPPPAAPAPEPDPLLPFLQDTVALLAVYDGAIAGQPALAARLIPLRDDHRAHVAALQKEIGPPATAVPQVAVPTPAGLTPLITAEQHGQQQAVTACLSGPGYRAELLGSIAACRACHLVALR